jgi:hypothetical protein
MLALAFLYRHMIKVVVNSYLGSGVKFMQLLVPPQSEWKRSQVKDTFKSCLKDLQAMESKMADIRNGVLEKEKGLAQCRDLQVWK